MTAAYANGITLDFSCPGKPTDNAYVESFNATVRLECLGRPAKRLKNGVQSTTKWDLIAQLVTGRQDAVFLDPSASTALGEGPALDHSSKRRT